MAGRRALPRALSREHVRLTEAGLEALRMMDEQGCAGHVHVKRRERCHAKFRFHRKRAA